MAGIFSATVELNTWWEGKYELVDIVNRTKDCKEVPGTGNLKEKGLGERGRGVTTE